MQTLSNPKLESFLSLLPIEAKQNFIETAEIIKPMINDLHSRQAMHQNYYGEYMALISKLNGMKERGVKYWAFVCLIAGCNPLGIEAAVKNM